MSFLAHEENGLFIKTSTVLSGVRHGFSTRIGGVSPAPWDSLNLGVGRGDDMDRVRENYRRFCAALGVDGHRAVLSKQVHEDNVRHVTAEDCGKGLFRDRDYTSVDAMVTDTPGIPLVVFSADCGIILLHDPVHGAVGAAHAGWRGAAGGIVYKTVRRMQELFGTDFRAWKFRDSTVVWACWMGTCGPPSGRPSAPAVLKRTQTCPRLWRPPWGRRRSRISPAGGPSGTWT